MEASEKARELVEKVANLAYECGQGEICGAELADVWIRLLAYIADLESRALTAEVERGEPVAWMVETEVGGDSGNWAHDPRGLFHDERDAKSRVDEWVRTYGIPTKYIRVVPLYRDRSGGGE